jgi:predicted ABC-type ATPase
VKAGVAQGGHNVAMEVVKRRYSAGIENFDRYKSLVDSWQLHDNSGAPPILQEEG